MAELSLCCNSLTPPPLPTFQHHPHQFSPRIPIVIGGNGIELRRGTTTTAFAAKSGGFSLNSILKSCETCGGKGALECSGCKGTGRNKKNGNIFERWNGRFKTCVVLFYKSSLGIPNLRALSNQVRRETLMVPMC
ncbi:hypothetical protein SO802_003291 [Lithocarpus litseifolius]|uniref:Uncharacterized protein n=1 Tax=Lithocarpus litseifolius TaxID=425828 RepID=A0AAW2DZP5_9ROSI